MIEKILVAVDLEDTDLTERMLAVTSDFAQLKGAQITLVHVESDIPPAAAIQLPDDYQAQTSSTVSKQLGDLVARYPGGKIHAASWMRTRRESRGAKLTQFAI